MQWEKRSPSGTNDVSMGSFRIYDSNTETYDQAGLSFAGPQDNVIDWGHGAPSTGFTEVDQVLDNAPSCGISGRCARESGDQGPALGTRPQRPPDPGRKRVSAVRSDCDVGDTGGCRPARHIPEGGRHRHRLHLWGDRILLSVVHHTKVRDLRQPDGAEGVDTCARQHHPGCWQRERHHGERHRHPVAGASLSTPIPEPTGTSPAAQPGATVLGHRHRNQLPEQSESQNQHSWSHARPTLRGDGNVVPDLRPRTVDRGGRKLSTSLSPIPTLTSVTTSSCRWPEREGGADSSDEARLIMGSCRSKAS